MSTVAPLRNERRPVVGAGDLRGGDRLDQPEFHQRYLRMATDDKVELVEGRVVMASPVSHAHSSWHFLLNTLLGFYVARTSGVIGGVDSTVIFDESNELQPDAHLRIAPQFGGQSRCNADGYIHGGPEWVGEIAYSSVSVDLHDKKFVYERNGVQEYFVYEIEAKRLHLFRLVAQVRLAPDSEGILKSQVMPGLWIDSVAFIANDSAKLLQTLEMGLASSEHEDFVERLTAGHRSTG